MDAAALLFGSSVAAGLGAEVTGLLQREGAPDLQDNTDYGVKDAAARDFDDVSGSDISSDEGGEAMDLGEDELQEADALNAGATKDIKDPRWARAIRILTEGHASDMPRHEVWAVCSSLGTKSEDAIFKWTELFQLDSGKTGEDLLLEADAQKAREMLERRYAHLHMVPESEDALLDYPTTVNECELFVRGEVDDETFSDQDAVDDKKRRRLQAAEEAEDERLRERDQQEPEPCLLDVVDWETSVLWEAPAKPLVDRASLLRAPPGWLNPASGPVFLSQHCAPVADSSWMRNIIWDEADAAQAAAKGAPPLILDLDDAQVMWTDRLRTHEAKASGADATMFEGAQETDPLAAMSNDVWYRVKPSKKGGIARVLDRTLVQHALPALNLSTFKTFLDPGDLVFHHRPRLYVPKGHTVTVHPMAAARQAVAEGEPDRSRYRLGVAGGVKGVLGGSSMQSKADLSAVHGAVVQLEYLEQYPPLLNNVGMGLHIIDYYRQKTETDVPPEPEWGETMLLHPVDESPFVGDVPRGQHVLGVSCSMFRAPVHPHPMPSTDFILIHSLDYTQATLRPCEAAIVVGQELPLWEVPAPATKPANDVVKSRLSAFVYRWFRNPVHRGVLQIEDVRRAFPSAVETSIRKTLAACGRFVRGGDMGGWWLLKDDFVMPSEEEIQRDLPPEMVCAYESMMAAQARLKYMGIVRHFNPYHVRTALDRSRQSKREGIRQLERMLLVQPWHVTSAFREGIETHSPLQLQGYADPSMRGEMWDITKVPMRAAAGSAMADAIDKQRQGGKRKRRYRSKLGVSVVGSDLRRLDHVQTRKVLEAFGCTEAEIPANRWKRIELIRDRSILFAQNPPDDADPDLYQFARSAAAAAMRMRQTPFDNPTYAKELREGWQLQREILANSNPDWSSSEESSDEEEDADNAKERDAVAAPLDAEAAQLERELEDMLKGAEQDAENQELEDMMAKELGQEAQVVATGRPLPFVKKLRAVKDKATKQHYEVLEIIIKPAEVKLEVEKKRRSRNNTRAPKSLQDVAAEAELQRKKRRIRENIRRLKNDKEVLNKVVEAIDHHDHKKLFEEAKLVCGRCGMPGHMRTNKICPKYEHKEGDARHVLLEEPTVALAPSVRRAFDYVSSMEHSVAVSAARQGLAGWNKWDSELASVMARPSADELIKNPPKPTRIRRRRRNKEAVADPANRRGGKRRPPKQWIKDDDALVDEESAAGGSEDEEEEADMDDEDDDENLVLDDDDEDGDGADLDAASPVPGSRRRPRALSRANDGARGAVEALNALIVKCLDQCKREPDAQFFTSAVSPADVPDYYDVVSQPIHLLSMRTRATKNGYWSVAEFHADLDLMLSNCRLYNEPRPANAEVLAMCERLVPCARNVLCTLFGGQDNMDANESVIKSEGALENDAVLSAAPRSAIAEKPKVRARRPPPSVPRPKKPPTARKPPRRKKDDEDSDEDADFRPNASSPPVKRARTTGRRRNVSEDEDEDDEEINYDEEDDDDGAFDDGFSRSYSTRRSARQPAPSSASRALPPAARPAATPAATPVQRPPDGRLVGKIKISLNRPSRPEAASAADPLNQSLDMSREAALQATPMATPMPASRPVVDSPLAPPQFPEPTATPVALPTPAIKLKLKLTVKAEQPPPPPPQ